MAARPARDAHGPAGLHLGPDPPPDFVGFGNDALLVHRQHLALAHDELAVDHHRLDVGRVTAVNHRGHYATGRHEAELDQKQLDAMYDVFQKSGFRFRELVLALVTSDAFLGKAAQKSELAANE